MKKKSIYLLSNLWWLIPLSIILLFWQHSAPILLMLIFAYLGRVVLNPVIKVVENWIGNRTFSVIIVIFLLLLLCAVFSTSLFPFIYDQSIALQSAISVDALIKFQTKLTLILQSILPTFIVIIFSDLMANFDISMSDKWAAGLSQIKSFIGGAGTIVFALGSAFMSFLIFMVFMTFFLLEGENFHQFFLHAVPGEKYGLAKRMLEKTSKQIHSYILGQLMAGISVAITSIIGLFLLQWATGIFIPYTILIGIIAGLFNLIPFIGPVIGMIPAIIIYLVTDQVIPIHIFYVLLIIGVFAIVQLIDNLAMSPYFMGRSVGIHPMLVIILILFGASVGGILGMLFAVPIAAIMKVIIEELVISFKKH